MQDMRNLLRGVCDSDENIVGLTLLLIHLYRRKDSRALFASALKEGRLGDLSGLSGMSDIPNIEDVAVFFGDELDKLSGDPVLASLLLENLDAVESLPDSDRFGKDYAEWFEKVLQDCCDNCVTFSHKYSVLPAEIEELASRLCGCSEGTAFYVPYSGPASFCTGLPSGTDFLAQEPSPILWAIGMLRLDAHGADTYRFLCQNPVSNVLAGEVAELSRRADCIMVGLSDVSQQTMRNGTSFLSEMLGNLKENGQLFAIVPPCFLTAGKGKEREFRMSLVESGYACSIIQLPENLFGNTSLRHYIIHIDRRKGNPEHSVRFVDASHCCTRSRRLNILQTDEVLALISGADSGKVKSVPAAAIFGNDCSLSPEFYLATELTVPEGYERVRVGEIAALARTSRAGEKIGRLVKGADLSDSPFEWKKSFEDFEESELPPDAMKLSRPAIICSRLGGLRATYVEASADLPVFLPHCAIALEIIEGKVFIPYFIYALNEAARRYATGTNTIVADILSWRLDLPGIEIQRSVYRDLERQHKLALVKEYH